MITNYVDETSRFIFKRIFDEKEDNNVQDNDEPFYQSCSEEINSESTLNFELLDFLQMFFEIFQKLLYSLFFHNSLLKVNL